MTFRLFAWRYFVFSHGVFSLRNDEKTTRRINAKQKKKRRHAKTRKDASRKDNEITVSNDIFLRGVFSSFRAKISSFRMALFRLFVFSHGFFSSVCFFSWRFCVCRLFVWRLFAAKRQKDEMAQSNHHNLNLVTVTSFCNYHKFRKIKTSQKTDQNLNSQLFWLTHIRHNFNNILASSTRMD